MKFITLFLKNFIYISLTTVFGALFILSVMSDLWIIYVVLMVIAIGMTTFYDFRISLTKNSKEIDPVVAVNVELFERYNRIVFFSELDDELKTRLITMGNYVISNPEMRIDKQSRWLGFIQGVLFENKLLDLDIERDFTREKYHKAYALLGEEKPKTVDILNERYANDGLRKI